MDITICGGGTAGWIAAFSLLRGSRVDKVRVIESSKIGVIGAGEASSGLLYSLLEDEFTIGDGLFFNGEVPRVNLQDFNEKVEAGPKFAILHEGWAKAPGSYFGPITSTPSEFLHQDIMFLAAVAKWGNRASHQSNEIGIAYEINAWPLETAPALHFNGNKFATYMKDFLSYDSRLEVIDATIDNVNLDSRGWIESVNLDDGSEVRSDFWFDATGFKKLLMSKMGSEWISYKDVLPVDSAIPFIEEYKSMEMAQPITKATAMNAGWMWKSPLDSRKGAGYVYSSQFISDDEALEEVESFLGRKIEPIKTIKFSSGRINETWKNNCIAIGLASSFLEPLEATSIHSTLMQMIGFTREFLSPSLESTVTEHNIRKYNERITKILEHYKDFTVFHYQGGRDDTPFWSHITNDKISTPKVDDYIEKSQTGMIPGDNYFDSRFELDGLWKWTLAGLDLISKEQAVKQLEFYNMKKLVYSRYNDFYGQTQAALLKAGNPFAFYPRGSSWTKTRR